MPERNDFDKHPDVAAIRQMVDFGRGIGDVSRVPRIERAIYEMRVDPFDEFGEHGQSKESRIDVGPIFGNTRLEKDFGPKQTERYVEPRLIDVA